jgi:hypothetical protein
MRANRTAFLVVTGVALALTGCVERRMLIRSEPTGAPAWVNENYVGVTPVDYEFAHYGAYRVRIGPIRDENDRLVFGEVEGVREIEAPWFEAWPIDLFFEAIYPGLLVDEHVLPAFKLPPAEAGEEMVEQSEVTQLREQAEKLRQRALYPVPEEAPQPIEQPQPAQPSGG